MKFITSDSPHIFERIDKQRIMLAVITALLPTAIIGIYFFGKNAFFIIAISIATALLTDTLIKTLLKRKVSIDFSVIITGLLIALILPPTVPIWIPIIGSAFAIAIAKWAFGGPGHVIFNPALAARAFLVASWPVLMATWVMPDGITGATPLSVLKMQGIKSVSYQQLFLGNISGTIGETSALALIIGGIFLLLIKKIDWRIPSTYIGTVFILTLVFGKDSLFHILAGGLIIGAFFMATDYTTSPITKNGKLLFGFGCGLLTALIRLFSGLPEGVMYSILIMNAFTPLIDRYLRPKPFGWKK